MTVKELFDFVTDPTINESNMNEYLEKAMAITSNRQNVEETDKINEEVISFIFVLN